MHINYIMAAKTNLRQIFQKKYEGFNLGLHMFGTLLSLIRLFAEPKWFLEAVTQKKKRDSNLFDLSCS